VERSLLSVVKAAVVAGLLAGLVAAGFHSLLTESVIDRAIQIEEQSSQARGRPAEEPLVSRRAQRVGLVFGFLLYGVAWGLLTGIVSHLVRSRLSELSNAKRGLVLAAVAGWSVAIFPFLKYPANPPGVGDPGTIGYRQGLYLGFIGLSIIGAVLAFGLQRLLGGRRSAWPFALVLYAACLVVVYLAMPPNPDPVEMPSEIVRTFRALSLAGLVLFWVVLGAAFGWLCRERGREAAIMNAGGTLP